MKKRTLLYLAIAGGVIYYFWGTISPILSNLWATITGAVSSATQSATAASAAVGGAAVAAAGGAAPPPAAPVVAAVTGAAPALSTSSVAKPMGGLQLVDTPVNNLFEAPISGGMV